jgi:hypothetical protein
MALGVVLIWVGLLFTTSASLVSTDKPTVIAGLAGLAEIEGQAGGRDADLAVVLGSGRRARGMMTGAWP